MKNLLAIALMLVICGTQPTQALTNDNEKLLKQLDNVIKNKNSYHAEKESCLQNLKQTFNSTSDPIKKYDIANKLFEGYLHYQADSARKCIDKKIELAAQLNDCNLNNEIMINRAEARGVMGMYNDAFDNLLQVDRSNLNKKNLIYYYKTYRACYGWISDYTISGHLRKKYLDKTEAYRDSILMNMEPCYERDIVWSEKMLLNGDADAALQKLQQILKELREDEAPNNRLINFVYYTLSEAYRVKNDIENQIYYLTLTSIADLKSATREYASLQKLAQLMYEQGEVFRAYDYLNCSMEDAASCNARLRFIEVAEFFPIIDRAYTMEQQRDRRRMNIFTSALGLLGVVLIILIVFLVRWNKRLNSIRRNLSDANSQLSAVNRKLAETGNIKDVYIARYLDRCANYLNKLDAYRLSLVKFAVTSRIDELFKAIKSDDFINEERHSFYMEFDRSFLDLFPDFVGSFNALLMENSRIYPKQGELLTAELRIYALVRLGVTDTNNIASFLGYSLATIYNYRSKVRNKAINRDTFEQEVTLL